MGNQKMYHKKFSLLSFVIVGLNIFGVMGSPSETVDPDTKASSPLINCGCQCSPLTFRDAKGEVQGNCRTVDGTGAQWCYVDSAYSSPTDIHPVAPHHPEVVVGAGPAGPGLGGVLTGNYDPESIGDIRLGDASSKINLPPSK